MKRALIKNIRGLQILDSRGRPTVEVEVELDDGSLDHASVPSGASTGTAEAYELRDGNLKYYEGRSVLRAVENVDGEIATALRGKDGLDQRGVDNLLLELDGTPRLERLGANAILAVSIATCRAAAKFQGIPLYRRIGELLENDNFVMPLPMVNILSGGLHAGRGMDVQDFLFIPGGAASLCEAIDLCASVRSAADQLVLERGLTTLLADEGGLSPGFASGRDALEMMVEVFQRAGLTPGSNAFIAIDLAATTLWSEDHDYLFTRANRCYTAPELIDLLVSWVDEFPIVSVEDGLAEEDWTNWKTLTEQCGERLQLIGDDLFATNLGRLRRGISEGTANAVLIKLNQNGTLSGSLDVIKEARLNGYATVISARSGETEDSFIADLAVGSAAGQIKIGSLRNSERLSKYNQLLRIERQTCASFAGTSALASFGTGK